MDTSSQGKRKQSTPCVDNKKQRRTSIIPNALKTNTNSISKATFKTTRNNERVCQNLSPTLLQNNRELATALNEARSRIKRLEDQRFEVQGDRQQLMEKYCSLTRELETMKNEREAKQTIDTKIYKEICESLRSKMQKATEKLLESSVFLAEVDRAVATLLRISSSQNKEHSVDLGVPLEITCDDDSAHRSQEAALSITKLTPSPSTASSSDSCEMTSPEASGYSTPSNHQIGLLTTIEDHSPMQATSDMHQVIDSLRNSPTENEVLNASQESMDCHNNSSHLEDSVDMNSPLSNSDMEIPRWSTSTPDCSPIRYVRHAVHRLASTPEDSEISRFADNLSAVESPEMSPTFNLGVGRRTSRRRNVVNGFRGYKEPTINGKLRQGDPFTDCSLYQPSQNKRKIKEPGHNLGKKYKK